MTARGFQQGQAFETAAAEDPSVESLSMAGIDRERLYRMHWSSTIEHRLQPLGETDGVITTASTSTPNDCWEVQLMSPEHDMLSGIYESCEKNGLSLTIDAIYEFSDNERSQHRLTDSQQTTLRKAAEMGYYEIPRTTSLSELADEFVGWSPHCM